MKVSAENFNENKFRNRRHVMSDSIAVRRLRPGRGRRGRGPGAAGGGAVRGVGRGHAAAAAHQHQSLGGAQAK